MWETSLFLHTVLALPLVGGVVAVVVPVAPPPLVDAEALVGTLELPVAAAVNWKKYVGKGES